MVRPNRRALADVRDDLRDRLAARRLSRKRLRGSGVESTFGLGREELLAGKKSHVTTLDLSDAVRELVIPCRGPLPRLRSLELVVQLGTLLIRHFTYEIED